MFDTNLWSSLGDDGSLPALDRLLVEHDAVAYISPATLLEIVDIPHEPVRQRIIRGLAIGPRRVRMRTEADLLGSEVVNLMRRTRPEWVRRVRNSAPLVKYRNWWLKGVWCSALSDSTPLHEFQARNQAVPEHIIATQKTNRRGMLEKKWDPGPLATLYGEADNVVGPKLPGWDGAKVELWRLQLASIWWYELGTVARRVAVFGGDRTSAEWIESDINLQSIYADPARLTSMWLEDATIGDVPRNWLNWAVDVVQWTEKIGPGNPGDVQLSSYLFDCDLFFTADERFVKILERVRTDAPFDFARASLVSGDRSVPTGERIASAWRSISTSQHPF